MIKEVIPGQKLLVIGMGSKSDMPLFEKTSVDAKTIDAFFHDKGIQVFHQAGINGGHSPDYMITSIHRTTSDTIGYATDMQRLVLAGYKDAAVFAGGLAFALPGVMAAESAVVPIIAVPMDEDAFYNTYKIPDGSPVGTVEVGNLEKGLRMAERILNHDISKGVNLVVDGDCKSADGVRKCLNKFGISYNVLDPDKDHYEGLTIAIAKNPKDLISLDERVEFGVFGLDKKESGFMDKIMDSGIISYVLDFLGLERINGSRIALKQVLPYMDNSVLIGRPINLALYTARIVGLSDNAVMSKLLDYRRTEAAKYPNRLAIQPDIDFV